MTLRRATEPPNPWLGAFSLIVLESAARRRLHLCVLELCNFGDSGTECCEAEVVVSPSL